MNIEIEQGFPMDMAGRLKARRTSCDGGHNDSMDLAGDS